VPTAAATKPPLRLALSPRGRLLLEPAPECAPDAIAGALALRVAAAFARSQGDGLLQLGAREVGTTLPPPFAFWRELGSKLLVRLCRHPDLETLRERVAIAPPTAELQELAARVPPLDGAENVTADLLAAHWALLLAAFAVEVAAARGPVAELLRTFDPLWQLVGRVHFHLAERKDDARRPFAFLATYTTGVGSSTQLQHRPLGRAVAESASARDKEALLALLQPVHRAAERSPLVRGLLGSGAIFHPQAWTPDEAHAFLRELPLCEQAGVVVRVPDWWHRQAPPRPQVRVTVGRKAPPVLGLEAMLDFAVDVAIDGEPLTAAERQQLLAAGSGLVRLRGRWVEVDGDRLQQALDHWQRVRKAAGADGVSFLAGMRMLAGTEILGDTATDADTVAWTSVRAGDWLAATLQRLREPRPAAARSASLPARALRATLRPYQQRGVEWLRLLCHLGLGACLADDMGLGKTVQVLALLLALRHEGPGRPSLLVLPASLLANWQAEIERFAPSLVTWTAHPSAQPAAELRARRGAEFADTDLVLTTYGTLLRLPWLVQTDWRLVVLDEAQAIKNPGAKQTRAVKSLRAAARIVLTGTPVENRLGDLWSLFDFLNPGLLGSPAAFGRFEKAMAQKEPPDYGPLRRLVAPYVLRRLKSDRAILQDLPDKTELKAFCGLSRLQAKLYQEAVDALAAQVAGAEGIQRRGVVLASLLRMKQICNHPSQWLGDGAFAPDDSGKFARVLELAEVIASRREKALVFTQFREMVEPLAAHLARAFGRPGVTLHGGTPLAERKRRIAAFQDDDAVPFFVLSVKAGGTGLNLTAASHVLHFDRWWNPAVEDQATDRAYRIGQHRNVLVHKFVCRGTVEQRIDELIEQKRGVAGEVLGGDGGKLVTEMDDKELLRFVSLDLRSAVDDG
jgi:non-specific serine/threonine protein kinase